MLLAYNVYYCTLILILLTSCEPDKVSEAYKQYEYPDIATKDATNLNR